MTSHANAMDRARLQAVLELFGRASPLQEGGIPLTPVDISKIDVSITDLVRQGKHVEALLYLLTSSFGQAGEDWLRINPMATPHSFFPPNLKWGRARSSEPDDMTVRSYAANDITAQRTPDFIPHVSRRGWNSTGGIGPVLLDAQLRLQMPHAHQLALAEVSVWTSERLMELPQEILRKVLRKALSTARGRFLSNWYALFGRDSSTGCAPLTSGWNDRRTSVSPEGMPYGIDGSAEVFAIMDSLGCTQRQALLSLRSLFALCVLFQHPAWVSSNNKAELPVSGFDNLFTGPVAVRDRLLWEQVQRLLQRAGLQRRMQVYPGWNKRVLRFARKSDVHSTWLAAAPLATAHRTVQLMQIDSGNYTVSAYQPPPPLFNVVWLERPRATDYEKAMRPRRGGKRVTAPECASEFTQRDRHIRHLRDWLFTWNGDWLRMWQDISPNSYRSEGNKRSSTSRKGVVKFLHRRYFLHAFAVPRFKADDDMERVSRGLALGRFYRRMVGLTRKPILRRLRQTFAQAGSSLNATEMAALRYALPGGTMEGCWGSDVSGMAFDGSLLNIAVRNTARMWPFQLTRVHDGVVALPHGRTDPSVGVVLPRLVGYTLSTSDGDEHPNLEAPGWKGVSFQLMLSPAALAVVAGLPPRSIEKASWFDLAHKNLPLDGIPGWQGHASRIFSVDHYLRKSRRRPHFSGWEQAALPLTWASDLGGDVSRGIQRSIQRLSLQKWFVSWREDNQFIFTRDVFLPHRAACGITSKGGVLSGAEVAHDTYVPLGNIPLGVFFDAAEGNAAVCLGKFWLPGVQLQNDVAESLSEDAASGASIALYVGAPGSTFKSLREDAVVRMVANKIKNTYYT